MSYTAAFGYADRAARTPDTDQTEYRLGSVSKQFTAMAVMLLVHDGKLRYDNRLTDVFPDFAEYGKAITVRQLLQHT